MLEALITSKTHLKLLLKFLLNSNITGYLCRLASEFGESTNSVRPKLNMINVGEKIDLDYLKTLVAKAQKIISRKIGYAVFTTAEFELQYPHINLEKLLPVWKNTD